MAFHSAGLYLLVGCPFLGLLSATLSYIFLCFFGALEASLITAPTLAAFSTTMVFFMLRALQLEEMDFVDIAAMYGIMGMFCGLIYSQVIAYRSFGLPDSRILALTSLVIAIPAIATALVLRSVVPEWKPYAGWPTDLLVAGGACVVGFLLVAPRIDDWLWHRWQTLSHPSGDVFPPSVTPLRSGPLRRELEDLATEDWYAVRRTADVVWRYTWQHAMIADVMYAALKRTPDSELVDRLASVTHGNVAWQRPSWLAQGGERSMPEIVANLRTGQAWDKLSDPVGNTSPVDNYLLTVQVCRDAHTIEEAIDSAGNKTGDEELRPYLNLLYAIQQSKARMARGLEVRN